MCRISFLLAIVLAQTLYAQTIAPLPQRSFAPGSTTEFQVSGTDLSAAVRCMAVGHGVSANLLSVQPTGAVVKLDLSADSFGPFSLLFAGSAGLIRSQTCLADSLNPVADNGQNHTRETAQPIEVLTTVSGFCDGSLPDFYRFTVVAGQSLAIEVLTQDLNSTMDPIVRITDHEGKTVAMHDDHSAGPEPKFTIRFEQAGEYWLQVYDSRYAANGAEYQLRVGDFPVAATAYPLAVQAGSEARFGVSDSATVVNSLSVAVAALPTATTLATLRVENGKSLTWRPVATSPYPQFTEDGAIQAAPLRGPLGISGCLSNVGETDSYRFAVEAGDVFRFRSRTRSLGSAAVLQLKLFAPNGNVVAETPLGANDEWSFDYSFAEAGEHRLEASDLLRRGGDDFTYWIEVVPSGTFLVAYKSDPTIREDFIVQSGEGAFAIDLAIARFGDDGPLTVDLVSSPPGLTVVNPQIPAGATEARIIVQASKPDWKPDTIAQVQFVVRSTNQPNRAVIASSGSLRRAKLPQVMVSPTRNDGQLTIVGSEDQPPLFELETAAPLRFAKPVGNQQAVLTIKRNHELFTGGVNILNSGLPDGWSVSATTQANELTTTFAGVDSAKGLTTSVEVAAFAELNGRGQIIKSPIPIEWFDPLTVKITSSKTVVAGGFAKLQVVCRRDGERQPVTFSLAEPTEGMTLVGDGVLPAEQDTGELTFAVGATVQGRVDLTLKAASQFAGQAYALPNIPVTIDVVAAPVELIVYPEAIQLDGLRSQQQVIVTGLDEAGQLRDWTKEAELSLDNDALAMIDGTRLKPRSNGAGTLIVKVGGIERRIPMAVNNVEAVRPIAFESEVLVALSKQSCNSGACHGSPSGKGGFRLSLRAFDPRLDELTLIREEFGRRINVFKPETSLLIEKPLMRVAHGGGRQLNTSDIAYEVLKQWVAEGAKADTAGTPRVIKLEVYPFEKRVLAVDDGGQQLAVTAHFADGTRRDVTQLVSYESSNNNVAIVDASGLVTPRSRGEAAILVRFLEHIESLPLMFVDQVEGFVWQAPPTHNYIDERVDEKLQRLKFLPSEVCSDAEFLRRVYLDLIGVLPTFEETRSFLADERADKRQQLVNQLLEREEFAKFWALKWGDLLRMTSKLVGDDGIYKYHRWVEEAFRQNMPYDAFARELITASGSTLSNPPANFYRTATDMNECVENISQVFLGARVQCAKCHNHPFERWTQDNYYGLGAFFNRVQRRTTERPGEMFIYSGASGEVTQPRTGQVMQPWVPQQGTLEDNNSLDRRVTFAAWLVADNNPYFAKMEANRIWSQFFSRGIVDPIDDFRDSNPASNAALLEALAADFVASGYDRRHLIRQILASRTYQSSSRTTEWNRDDSLYGSHQEPRLLSAEQLLDAINQALDLQQTLGNLPPGTRATHLPAPDLVKVEFLKTFGQPERGTVCACERGDDSNLSMAIELFNGPLMHEKLRDPNNRFRRRLAEGHDVNSIFEELTLAALCRFPTELERQTALKHCSTQPDPAMALEDLCWALFNTDEFLFQH